MKVKIDVDVPGPARAGVSAETLKPLFHCVIDAISESDELFGSVCSDDDKAIGTFIIEDE